MMVNAALFQDMVPAGTGAGSKPGAGGSEPQGGGFAKILSGHAEKESGSASEPQRSRSGAPSRADGSRDLQTRQGDAGEQVARGGEQQQEQPLPSVKELTAQAEAEQQPAADAENAAATAAEGAATPAQPQSRETQVPANGKGATADLKPVWVFDEPQAGAQAVQTEGGKIQLPVATAPAAAAEPAAALLAQQVVPQDAAALQGKLSGPEQKGRSTQESGKKQSGGASDDRAQQSDDSVAALQGGAMLTAFLYGPAASAAGSGTAKAVGTGAEADPVAGIAADATAAGQGKATAPHGEQPQAPVRGEASAVLEALQQKAFALAAQGEPQTARQELRAGGAQSPPQQSAAQQTAAQQTAAQQTAVALTAQHEQAAAPQNQAQFQATQLGAAPLATGEPNLPKAAPQHPESAAAKLPGNAEQSADPGKGEASREPQGAQQVAQNSPRSELTAQSAVITPTPSADADQVRAQDAAAQDPGRQAAAPLSGEKQETLQAVNGRQDGNGVKVAAEPAATEQKTASGGISGIKTATAAAVPHPAAAGNPGQNGSGEGERGMPSRRLSPRPSRQRRG